MSDNDDGDCCYPIRDQATSPLTREQVPMPNLTPLYLQMDVDVKALHGFIRNLMTGTCVVEWHEVEALRLTLAAREAEIIDLKTCQCEGCDMPLEGEAYCTPCVTKRVDELVSLLAACGATENIDGTLNFDATKFPVANRMAVLQAERDAAVQDAAHLRARLAMLEEEV